MQEHFQFDRQRFKDVVHYIVHYVGNHLDPEKLGNTKLHKVLYFADMLHYLSTGRPLTGADYQRQRFGPTARHLTWALKSLEAEGRVSTTTKNYYGYAKSEYHATKRPSIDCLSPDQAKLIEHMVGFVCAHTAAEISEFSHNDVWSSVAMGERIPYYAAFAMFPAEVTDEDLAEAAEEAARLIS
ncbi:MAG: Panacea domain-containing protein [Hyphomicrobiaceae bacterium]